MELLVGEQQPGFNLLEQSLTILVRTSTRTLVRGEAIFYGIPSLLSPADESGVVNDATEMMEH